MSTLLRGYAHCPGFVRRLRPRLVRATWNRAPAWREALRSNGRVILGPDVTDDAVDAYGLGVLENMQRFMEGIALASRVPPEVLLDRIETIEGLEEFREHFAGRSGRGIVLLSMHMGEFESAAAYIGRHAPIHVLYQRDPIGTLERMRTRARKRLGVLGHRVDSGLGTWVDLRDALERGEVVALLGDRVQPGQRGTPMPVFGREMEIPIGPFKLAESTGALVVPVFNWRLASGGLVLRMDAPLSTEGDLRADPANHAGLRGWIESMEAVIKAHPEQWLNVHPVWRDRGLESAA
ncbi:MAG: lysophospholipid acyltransferase family protein [Planctomycetota bacterium]|nr:lysophospholipid acyltransferase family protein [Planctomycetota bacterium]MEE2896056.1 lysophospholipid acyltransferase family protein [Planctomycetota bacterium]